MGEFAMTREEAAVLLRLLDDEIHYLGALDKREREVFGAVETRLAAYLGLPDDSNERDLLRNAARRRALGLPAY